MAQRHGDPKSRHMRRVSLMLKIIVSFIASRIYYSSNHKFSV